MKHHHVLNAMSGLRAFELNHQEFHGDIHTGRLVLPSTVREVTTNKPDLLSWNAPEDASLDCLTLVISVRLIWQTRSLRSDSTGNRNIWWNVKSFKFRGYCDYVGFARSHWNASAGACDGYLRKFCHFVGLLARSSAGSLRSIEFEAPGLLSKAFVRKVRRLMRERVHLADHGHAEIE